MRQKLPALFRLLCILMGVGLLLYPSLSTYLSEVNGSQATTAYDSLVEQAAEEEIDTVFEAAQAYNRQLMEYNGFEAPRTDVNGVPVGLEHYRELLDVDGTGMMGYISIPALGETIPVYHGTDESVLQVGIGHVENTSLPVGGASTHAALSGHRGLPTASLFTNLDQLEVGDKFYIRILNRTMAYEVDQILVVLPEETEELAIQEGKDFVTLITCTPYGVNSHRLLVRGTRIEYTPSEDGSLDGFEEKAQGSFLARIPMQYQHLLLGVVLIIGFIILRWIVLSIRKRIKKRGNCEHEQN